MERLGHPSLGATILEIVHRIWDEIKRHDLLRAQRINYYKDTSSPAPAYSNDQLYDFTGRVPVQKQYGDFAKMYFS